MKVTPPNQTLILASELASGRGPDSALGHAARLAAGGMPLKRVTILAAHTVVVQADYYSRAEALTDPRAAIEFVPRLVAVPNRPGAAPSSRNPVQLYARTQRHGDDAPPLLDVFA